MVSENGEPLPSDPVAPAGCCITLSGMLELDGGEYTLRMTFRNKVNGMVFSNVETGTFEVDGGDLSFEMREFSLAPFLLGPGTVNGDTITLLYGDEGPGSNQRRGVFVRS